MSLKIHASTSRLGKGAYGKTLCGMGFFSSSRSFPGAGEYQSLERIGGIRVFSELEFMERITSRGCCNNCLSRLGMDGVK